MAVDVVIHSARVVSDARIVNDSWVAFDRDRIVATGDGDLWRRLAPRTTRDAAGAWLCPGFIDLHGHGGGGHLYEQGPDAVVGARAVHRKHGTTRAVLSLVTARLDDLARHARMIAELAAVDPTILGSHLEGPFLDVEFRGAHDPALLSPPTADAVQGLLDAGAGTVRQITLAPELPGGLDAIRQVVAAGAIAAVGHTAADEATARAGFDAGATLLTHAFNAMPGIHHRAPGPVVAALTDERVTLEIISDGIHVHPDVIGLAASRAPGRIALVTDAMAATGFGDGHYQLGTRQVTVSEGVARTEPDGRLAGSTVTQDVAIGVAVGSVGMSVADAIDAATRVPARALGRASELGSLRPGYLADAVLLDEDLLAQAVWVAGAEV